MHLLKCSLTLPWCISWSASSPPLADLSPARRTYSRCQCPWTDRGTSRCGGSPRGQQSCSPPWGRTPVHSLTQPSVHGLRLNQDESCFKLFPSSLATLTDGLPEVVYGVVPPPVPPVYPHVHRGVRGVAGEGDGDVLGRLHQHTAWHHGGVSVVLQRDGDTQQRNTILIHYITLHYITIHCNTIHYFTLLYVTLQLFTLQYSALLYITLRYN